MPTSLDRVQVLLQPDEYAELSLLAKEERRSLASMSAVLITEAIKNRIRNGTFEPHPEDPAYAKAKQRQEARALGKTVSKGERVIEHLDALAEETGRAYLTQRKGQRSSNPKEVSLEEKRDAVNVLN